MSTEKSRSSWSSDHKYFLKATVKLLSFTKSGLFNLAITSVIVFEGDPDVSTKPPIFISSQQMYIADVDEELTEAERVAHTFILTLP